MSISASQVKELRDRTGVGIMDCKQALVKSSGDVDEAIKILRKMGKAKVAKKASRQASEGRIESYVHLGGKIAVMIELNCETDFVAKSDDFIKLARDIAMHIAASNPTAIKREDVGKDPSQAISSLRRFTPKIPACGEFMIGVKESTPNIPRADTVNVPKNV